MANTISNTDDIIDSRDVIARIEELEAIEDLDPASEDAFELTELKSLAEEASGYAPDWEYGECLIRDSYFKDYARELAEDCGMINRGASWPNDCIDWDRAARELQIDYTAVDFNGVTYWIR